MNVALCCIGKNENDYIKEYVEYYKSLGVDKIFLYDNNDKNGENFEDKISDFIDNGFVSIIDYRGEKVCQLRAYQDCYNKNKNEYDWIMFFDCDEYLRLLKHRNVKDYLSESFFNDYNLIHINWVCYGDNGLIGNENDDKNLISRFTKPIMPLDFKVSYKIPENYHIKSIVRGGLAKVNWKLTPHTPSNALSCCLNNGNKSQNSKKPFEIINVEYAYIKHFTTKTCVEYLKKIERGFPDHIIKDKERGDMLYRFFKYNEKTEEKEKILGIYQDTEKTKINDSNVTIFINTIKDEEYYPINQKYKLMVLGDNKLNKSYMIPTLYDNIGDNISKFNKFICEFTGIYWVWKNIKELPDYVGFCQYRKLFEFGNKIPNIEEIFEEHDVILPYSLNVGNMIKHYSTYHNIKDIVSLKNIFYDEKYSKYAKAFADTMMGKDMYCCNIFIMKKEDFNEYCEFIWGVASEFMRINNIHTYYDAVKRVENDKLVYLKQYKSLPQNGTIEYQARFMAYIIERLTNVFINYKFKNPYHVNVVEKDDKYGVKIFK